MARLPLEGVRVVDFCVVWAGPFCTMLLGDLGAEVIKVENPFVMQPMTRGTRARVPKEMLPHVAASVGGYPNNDPGPRPWNYTPSFVQLYRNKKSMTVDWRRPEGRAIIDRLIAQTDVVVENNAPGTMEKLGLGYDRLRAIKPDIIMVRMPAFGSTGPYADARATGVQLESVAGHSLLRGYADGDPSTNSAIYSGDYIAGAHAAVATMMALWHRRKTGRGQLVEVSQAETAMSLLFQAFMDRSINGRDPERLGNRSVYGAAPNGVYACRSPGTPADAGDRWIAITVASDREWRALRELMGQPGWAVSQELDTQEGRLAQHDLIDEHLAAWTRDFDDYDLFHRLQAAGIAAAPVLEASRVMDDPHVQARGLYQPQQLFDFDRTYRFSAPFIRMPETPATVRQPPVAMGEHNEYVYKQVIGVSDEEYETLKAAGHISMDFDESVP
jgi:crotonobetainyl-CoA:carnitine CoA-transferase CaiB-like acyl-CoA transferase